MINPTYLLYTTVSAGFFIGAAAYYINPSYLKLITIPIIVKLVRIYSIIEYHMEKVFQYMEKVYQYIENNNPNISICNDIKFLKSNELVPMENLDYGDGEITNIDFATYNVNNYNVVMKPNKLRVPKENDIPVLSSVYFISFTITYSDKPDEQPPLSLVFKSDKTNYFLDGNYLDKYIIWYETGLQHNLNKYGVEFTAQIMDHNVQLPTITDKNTILITKDNYEIYPNNTIT